MLHSEDIAQLMLLMEHENSWVSRCAQVALDLSEQHLQGSITDEELAELCLDLVKAADEHVDDLDTKAALVTAVYGMAEII